jgi:hypothetical protein
MKPHNDASEGDAGSQAYRILKSVLGSFQLGSVLLAEGSIPESKSMLQDLGATSLIITGRPTIIEHGVRGVGTYAPDSNDGVITNLTSLHDPHI